MTEHERLLEDFDDAYFALLMEGVANKEGERLEALNEMLQDNPEAALPESVDKRCLEAIDRHFAREQCRAGLRKTGKILRLAAIIMGISALLFTTAFAFSEHFRVTTLNLMLTVTERYTRFDIKRSDENNGQALSSSVSRIDKKISKLTHLRPPLTFNQFLTSPLFSLGQPLPLRGLFVPFPEEI